MFHIVKNLKYYWYFSTQKGMQLQGTTLLCLLLTTIGPDGSCFLAAWAVSKSALVITHERPKPAKTERYLLRRLGPTLSLAYPGYLDPDPYVA